MRPDEYAVAAPTLVAPARPLPAAPGRVWKPVSRRAWVGFAVALAAVAVLAGWALLAGSAGPPADDLRVDRLLGHQTGLLLPAPVTAAECTVALGRFRGITTAAGRGAFVSACVGAQGPSDPALTSTG